MKLAPFCKRFFVLCLLGVMMVNSCAFAADEKIEANTGNLPNQYDSDWRYWSQGASKYADLRAVGCRVVSFAKVLVELGVINPSAMNPDNFWDYSLAKGYFLESVLEDGNRGDAVVSYAADFGVEVEVKSGALSGSNLQSDADIIMEYLKGGYSVAVGWKYGEKNTHTVHILRDKSISDNKVRVSDSWEGSTYNPFSIHDFVGYKEKYTWYTAFRVKQSKPINYFAVTKENFANIRSGYYKTETPIYEALRGTYYKIIGSFTNEHNNLWYQVELPDGRTGWIFSENGKTCTPRTETIKNYNCDLFVPIHSDYYGKASTIFKVNGRDNDSTTVTVYAEVQNSYGNTWYLVSHAKGMGWLWADYCSEKYAAVCGVSAKLYYIIDDPEAGTFVDAASGMIFDVQGTTSLIINAGYTSIDGFKNASSMKSITIPTSVTSIGVNAFSSCNALTTVYYAGTSAQWNAISIASGNGNLTRANIICQGNGASTAGFSSCSASPTSTSAMLKATAAVTSGSGTFTGSGIRVYNSSNTLIAHKDESHSYYRSASGNSGYNIWYDVQDELGVPLTPNSTYYYQFYTVFNGTTIWSQKYPFTTAAQALNYEFTLNEVTEDQVVFSFKGTSPTKGNFSEFGCYIVDQTTGRVWADYSNTTNENLNYPGGAYNFEMNNWKFSVKAGHTYSIQLYYVFNGVRYPSSVYSVTVPDYSAPTITSGYIANQVANGFVAGVTARDNNQVKDVQFAVWSEPNGKDDLVYHSADQDIYLYEKFISVFDGHNGEVNCVYNIEIIATDMNGNQSTGLLRAYVDAVRPTISDISCTPLGNGTFRVDATVTDDQGTVSLVEGVTTSPDGTLSQNKSAGKVEDNRYSFIVDCASLGGQNGYYTTRINAYDPYGNLTTYTVSTYMDMTAPVISDVCVENIDQYGFDVSCLIDEVGSEIETVLFPTWTDACADGSGNSQDDIDPDWETNGKYVGTLGDDGRWTYHVRFADHNNERGLYNIRIEAHDAFGNVGSYRFYADIEEEESDYRDNPAMVMYVRDPDDGRAWVLYQYDGNSAGLSLDWNQARILCESMGGHLVTITGKYEWEDVQWLLEKIEGYAWIGAYGTETSARWITGENFNYSAWSQSVSADDLKNSSMAAAASKDGWVMANKSNSITAFICEFEATDLSGKTTIVLPESLTRIESEAFAGIKAQVVILPETCTFIASRAFADCPRLEYVVIPSGAEVYIADDAFSGSNAMVIEK